MSEALLIDIGNSRVKWALSQVGAETGALHQHGSFRYVRPERAEQQRQVIDELMAVLPTAAVSAVVIISVAQRGLAQGLGERLQGHTHSPVTLAQVQRQFAGLTVAYERTENLGVDRWMAMLGAGRTVGYPCVVIDFGTAVTVDAVDGSGLHLGGAIAPGRTLQRRSLRQSTARIDAGQGEPVPPSLFGRDTGEAVAAGVDHGLAALVARADASVRDRLAASESGAAQSGSTPLLVTGGDAPALMPLLPAHAKHVDDLVLEGGRALLENA